MINEKNCYAYITEMLLFSQRPFEHTDWSYLCNLSGINQFRNFRVFLIKDEKKDLDLETFQNLIFKEYHLQFCMKWNNLIICIVPVELLPDEKISELYDFLYKHLSKTIKISCGGIKEHLENVSDSFKEAARTFDMIESMKFDNKSYMKYEDLGVYRILYELNDVKVFEEYASDMFRELWKYDDENDAKLFTTLECYLNNDCNLEITAAELYIHVNTLRYRIKQIEQITNKNLKSISVLSEFLTAFKVRRLIEVIHDR